MSSYEVHNCYIQKDEEESKEEKSKEKRGFIFYDMETYLNESGKHIVNLIMAIYYGMDC